MKPINRVTLICIVLIALFAISPLYAQTSNATMTTSGGLSVSYPSSWSAVENSPLNIIISNSDDWLINIAVGDEAIYSSDHKGVYTSAVDAMQYFTDFLALAETSISDIPPTAFEIGIIAALKQTAVSSTNVPYDIITFNLPDGTVVLALMGNQTLLTTPTLDMQRVFHAVLASVVLTTPTETAAPEEDPSATEEIYIPEGAVLLSDLEVGMLRFEEGVELAYPDEWSLYSENPYVQSTASLFYGESMLTYEAFVQITIQDNADLSIDTFRSSIMSMGSMLYTGRDDYDPTRDILTETLPDGRVIEFLDTSEAESLLGNTYIVPLDARYWVWVMFLNIPVDDDAKTTQRLEDVMTMVKSISLIPQEGAFTYEGYQLTIQTATCDHPLSTDDINQSTPYAVFECPANCLEETYSVWGVDTYTLDSTLCASAIHSGAISNAEGGTILTTWLPGQTAYEGSERNGVVSDEYGEWEDSFMVEPFAIPGE